MTTRGQSLTPKPFLHRVFFKKEMFQFESGMVPYSCNSSHFGNWGRGSQAQGLTGLQNEFEASLAYLLKTTCLKIERERRAYGMGAYTRDKMAQWVKVRARVCVRAWLCVWRGRETTKLRVLHISDKCSSPELYPQLTLWVISEKLHFLIRYVWVYIYVCTFAHLTRYKFGGRRTRMRSILFLHHANPRDGTLVSGFQNKHLYSLRSVESEVS